MTDNSEIEKLHDYWEKRSLTEVFTKAQIDEPDDETINLDEVKPVVGCRRWISLFDLLQPQLRGGRMRHNRDLGSDKKLDKTSNHGGQQND